MPNELTPTTRRPLPDNLEIVKTKSGREVLIRKGQKIMAGNELKSKAQEEAKKMLQGLGEVKFS